MAEITSQGAAQAADAAGNEGRTDSSIRRCSSGRPRIKLVKNQFYQFFVLSGLIFMYKWYFLFMNQFLGNSLKIVQLIGNDLYADNPSGPMPYI
ncbi:hypothetical protein [Azospirillum thiophilum]|uniref:hypothetical protein n=1 Tax=Azospirillum thiophilum TaxID=528244 RepID=UPI0013141B23|nr:hypothetical protein [Azospirillum thiophilum]